MAETQNPEAATVTLGGEVYTLALTMSAFRLAQLRYRDNAPTFADLQGLDKTKLPRFVWVALQPFKKMDEEEALTLLAQDPAGEEKACEAVLNQMLALAAVMQRLDSEGDEEGKA